MLKGFILIDLEPILGKGIKEGLAGWPNSRDGWGHPTPGLISCCPLYAERIVATAMKHLSAEAFESMRPELEAALKKAEKINERRKEIDAFHANKGVTLQSAAIPSNIDLTALDLKTKVFGNEIDIPWSEIIADINAVIAKQVNDHPHLAHSREWRLTPDGYTADSNFKETIYSYSSVIKSKLLPFLKDAGIVHSWVKEEEEAKALDIDLRRRVGGYDWIIQF